MANNNIDTSKINIFKDESLKNKYLLKLAPDLSVLDYAEKYMIDKNYTGINGLFFYKPSDFAIESSLPFKRAIFKLENVNITSFKLEDHLEATTIAYAFSNGDDTILICIDDGINGDGIKLKNCNEYYIVGVCF